MPRGNTDPRHTVGHFTRRLKMPKSKKTAKKAKTDSTLDRRDRGYVFTINNYTDEEVEACKTVKCQAIRCGLEVGEKGTPHIQGAIYFKNAKTIRTMKKWQPRAHFETMMGCWDDQEYCLKDGKVIRDFGEGPKQGKRHDLLNARDDIDAGATLPVLWANHFEVMKRSSRALTQYKDIVDRQRYRNEMPELIWYVGASGTGKSHRVFEGYNPTTHYLHCGEDGKWFDGYEGEEIVIFQEVRANQFLLGAFLQMCDKWPYKVPRRCREPKNFLAKKLLFTSPLTPREVFQDQCVGSDKLDQIDRRFHGKIVYLTEKYVEPEVILTTADASAPELILD